MPQSSSMDQQTPLAPSLQSKLHLLHVGMEFFSTAICYMSKIYQEC